MENIENRTSAARRPLPLVTRIARSLVCSQLGQLGAGQLVVREPGYPEQVFGDGDQRWPVAHWWSSRTPSRAR